MAGDSENDTERFNYLLYGVDSNARRFKTNFDSIFEKYHRPFEDDDILNLENLSIEKDNGLLQRKRKVSFGAAKLKCSRGKGTSLKAEVLQSTFTIDQNISMAIKRDCQSLLVGAEVDDDDDAETLSPFNSEDEEDHTDDDDSSDNSDSGCSKNECSSECVEQSSESFQTLEDNADEICSNNSSDETDKESTNVGPGFGKPRQSRRCLGRRRDLTDSCENQVNATVDINAELKAEKQYKQDRHKCHQRTCKSAYYQREQKEREQNGETKVVNSMGAFSLKQFALSPCTQRNSPSSVNSSNSFPLRNSFSFVSAFASDRRTFQSVHYQKEPKTSKPGETKIANSMAAFPHKQLASSPSLHKNRASTGMASYGSPLRNSLSTAASHTSNSNISGSSKDLKLVSIASPLKCESLNSSGNSSKMNTSLSSSFSSPVSKSIASSFGDLTLRALTSPKTAPRNNTTIDKILCSPHSQQSSPKSVRGSLGNETFVSNAATLKEKGESIFKSPTSAVRRRIIPTKVDSTEKRKNVQTNLFPKNDSKCNGGVYKNNIDSMQELHSVDETLQTSCSKSDCKISCSDGNFSKVCESLPSGLQTPKSVDGKLCQIHTNSLRSNFSRPRAMYPNANSTEMSIVCETDISTGSLYSDQCLEGCALTSNICNTCKVTAPAVLPRTNDAHLKEISSINRPIDSNTFCVNVSFSSSEDDLRAGINNFDFIFQEGHANQKQLPCHSKAHAYDKNPTLSRRNPSPLEKNDSAQLVKKLTSGYAHANLSALSSSTQTSNDAESISKSPCYPTLVDSHVPRSNHLGHHGFDESKWKTSETKKTIVNQRGFKRKDFSTSDYFTDSSSPRKLAIDRSDQCTCASRYTQTNKLNPCNQLTKSICHPSCHYSTASAPSPIKCTPHLESAQQSPGILTQNQKYFDVESLLKSPIIVDRNKLRKRLALKKKTTHSLEQTLVNNSSLESTAIDSSFDSIVKSTVVHTLTEASIVPLENNFEKYGSKKVNDFTFSTREKSLGIYFKDVSVQTNDCLDCNTFIVSKRENFFAPFLRSSSPKKSSNSFNGESEVASDRSEPRSCCCQCSHTEQESPRTQMFPNWYINKFCPKNPSRIDSDDIVEPSLTLESFKESLKALMPNRNILRPPDLPGQSRNPQQDLFIVPDVEFHQRPPKLRKISSSKPPLKKPVSLSRKDCSSKDKQLKSFHPQNSAKAMSRIRASTPFSEMPSLALESSFFNTTLSTIVEPLSYQKEAERKPDQSFSSDLNDEIDLLE